MNELILEKGLIDDPTLPITTYNYSTTGDHLVKCGVIVSLLTIITRDQCLGCYQPHSRKKVHDHEVLTTAIGALIQLDASHHRWSPYAKEIWIFITSLDNFSCKILYANLFEQEIIWAHTRVAEALMRTYVITFCYYVDSLRVFRFVQGRDIFWRRYILQTDEADPQWRQVMRVRLIDVSYTLLTRAKGKVERPYRWLQDRIVRTCAIKTLTTIEDVCVVFEEEPDPYNNRQVHSTTGEVSSIRFDKVRNEGNSLFRSFILPKPDTSAKDIF